MPRDTPHRIQHPLILYPTPLELLHHHPLARVFKIDSHRATIIQTHPPPLKLFLFALPDRRSVRKRAEGFDAEETSRRQRSRAPDMCAGAGPCVKLSNGRSLKRTQTDLHVLNST